MYVQPKKNPNQRDSKRGGGGGSKTDDFGSPNASRQDMASFSRDEREKPELKDQFMTDAEIKKMNTGGSE